MGSLYKLFKKKKLELKPHFHDHVPGNFTKKANLLQHAIGGMIMHLNCSNGRWTSQIRDLNLFLIHNIKVE